MVIVKIYGRQTPSTSYQVAGKLGVPGDSGAWVVDNEEGRACGHVLAWSTKKKVAYICPMEVLLRDIGETLGAKRISLPGGEDVYCGADAWGDGKRDTIRGTMIPDIEEEFSLLLKDLQIPDENARERLEERERMLQPRLGGDRGLGRLGELDGKERESGKDLVELKIRGKGLSEGVGNVGVGVGMDKGQGVSFGSRPVWR